MFKRKSILSMALAFILIFSNALVFAQEAMPEVQPNPLGGGLSIPKRNASPWALDELVDSDRYGLYKAEDLYKGNLRELLSDDLKQNLLKNFKERLEVTDLKAVEKPAYLAEVKNSKTRGGFLREIYNVLVLYENEENLGKDPIMYLNHTNIAVGSGRELFLDRNITTEEAILFAKRAIDYIYKENDLASQGLMWKVENKGNIVYLLGSIHYGTPDLYPLRDDIMKNFSESQALYVEVDISNEEEMMRVMMEKMEELEKELKESSKYQDGTTLESVLDKELYSQIEDIMKKHNVAKEEYESLKIQGVEQKLNEIIVEEAFANMPEENEAVSDKEMEEMMDELSENEFMQLLIEGPKLGLDFYFLDKAKTSDKKVGELESMESQFELLFGGGGIFADNSGDLSQEELTDRLKEVLKNFDDAGNIVEREIPEGEEISDEDFEKEMEEALQEQVDIIDEMFDAVKKGDAEKLAKLFTESEGQEVFGAQLLGERDKDMAKRISELLDGEEKKTYFVVAGAAHFVVDATIVDNLKNMGYTVERIK